MIERLSEKEFNIITGTIILALVSFLLSGSFISVINSTYTKDVIVENKTEEVLVKEEIKEYSKELSSEELVMNALGKTIASNYDITDKKYNELDKKDIFLYSIKMLINDKKYTKIDTDETGDIYLIYSEDIKSYAYKIFNHSDFIYLEEDLTYKYNQDLLGYTFYLNDVVVDEISLVDIKYSNDKAYFSYYNHGLSKSILITFIKENNVYRVINFVLA